MQAVHPTETASDGKVIEQSVFIKKSDRLDNVIYCAQCGFPVDLNKRSTGDSLGAIPDPVLASAVGTPPSPGISFTDSYGDPVDTGSGCPFCNTMAPTAPTRNKNGFDNVGPDLSNL